MTVFHDAQSQKHITGLQAALHEYAAKRREQFYTAKAYWDAGQIADHIDNPIDTSNPKFKETGEYEKLKLLLPKGGMPMDIFKSIGKVKVWIR